MNIWCYILRNQMSQIFIIRIILLFSYNDFFVTATCAEYLHFSWYVRYFEDYYEYRAAIALRGQPAVWQFRYISFVDCPAPPPSDVIRNVFKKYISRKKNNLLKQKIKFA